MFTKPYELAVTVQDAGAQQPSRQSMSRARRRSARRGAKLLLRLPREEMHGCSYRENPCSIRSLWNHDNATSGKKLHTKCEVCPREKGNFRRKYEYFPRLTGFPRIPTDLHYYIGAACPHYVTAQQGSRCAQDAVAGVRARACEAGILKGPHTSSHTCLRMFLVDRGTPTRSTDGQC